MTSTRYIPLPVRCILWGRAAGRCEFSGCNTPLFYHSKTKEAANIAEAAHVIGFSEDGPRGESHISAEIAKDSGNLMLLCRNCHKTVDTNSERYPVDLLCEMKKAHESRIALLTGIDAEKQSHVLLYGANVGQHSAPLSFQRAVWAMIPEWYPAEPHEIRIGMVNGVWEDRTPDFWKVECQQLRGMIEQRLRPRLASGEIKHLSIFAFAPQPLLMYFGFLLSDIPPAEVYQLHREPADWKWQPDPIDFSYVLKEPEIVTNEAALILGLSASISDERVLSVVPNASIWRLEVAKPHNDFLKSWRQLQMFRETVRPLMDRIKLRHGEDSRIHVFPAVPLAIAVDFGRVIMPKADLDVTVYDENKGLGGFIRALDLDMTNRDKR